MKRMRKLSGIVALVMVLGVLFSLPALAGNGAGPGDGTGTGVCDGSGGGGGNGPNGRRETAPATAAALAGGTAPTARPTVPARAEGSKMTVGPDRLRPLRFQ